MQPEEGRKDSLDALLKVKPAAHLRARKNRANGISRTGLKTVKLFFGLPAIAINHKVPFSASTQHYLAQPGTRALCASLKHHDKYQSSCLQLFSLVTFVTHHKNQNSSVLPLLKWLLQTLLQQQRKSAEFYLSPHSPDGGLWPEKQQVRATCRSLSRGQ